MPTLPKLLRRLLGRPEPFGARQFAARERFRPDYELVAESLLELLEFDDVVDVGCANGFLIERFQAEGREVAGIEASPEVVGLLPESLRDRVAIGDFAELSGRWDLVCCVEVAEHILPARSAELVEVVSGAARRHVYFTAAPPGQGGRGHINCRPHEEWIEMFAARGWSLDEAATASLVRRLEALEEAPWLAVNSLLFGLAEDGLTDDG